VLFSLAALIVALDQATKSIVRSRLALGETWPEGWELIRVAHIENTGAAFGILSDYTQLLTVGALLAVFVVTALIVGLAPAHRWYALCLSLVLGGAVGNLIDRIRLGAVTDFIDPIAYPAFNVADSAIVLGVGALLVFAFFDQEEEPEDVDEAVADELAAQDDVDAAGPRHHRSRARRTEDSREVSS
jgi:signal peptidase II